MHPPSLTWTLYSWYEISLSKYKTRLFSNQQHCPVYLNIICEDRHCVEIDMLYLCEYHKLENKT